MFTKNTCTVLNGTTIAGRGKRKEGVYVLGITGRSATERAMAAEDRSSKMLNLWHARFGHAGRRVIKYMAEKELVLGLHLNEKVALPECGPCVEATMTNGPMKSRNAVTSVPGTVSHTDVPEMDVMSLVSAKYFALFIDEASGHVFETQLKSTGDAASHLVKYVKWVERQTGNRVKRIVLDGKRSV